MAHSLQLGSNIVGDGVLQHDPRASHMSNPGGVHGILKVHAED
jgi:hypothetical protein